MLRLAKLGMVALGLVVATSGLVAPSWQVASPSALSPSALSPSALSPSDGRQVAARYPVRTRTSDFYARSRISNVPQPTSAKR